MGTHLDDLADGEAIVLTTETPRWIAQFISIFAGFGIAAASVNLIGYTSAGSLDFGGIGIRIYFDVVTVLLGLLIPLFTLRGTWIIDPDGIAFHPCHRRSRSLRWSSVEGVRWTDDQAAFRGGGVSIALPWRMFPPKESEAARLRIEKLLATDFDLSPPERPTPEPLTRADLPRALARWAMLFGIAVGWTAIWAAGTFALLWAGWTLRDGAARRMAGVAGLGWMLAMFLVPAALALRMTREERRTRVGPWAWRARRAKPTVDL